MKYILYSKETCPFCIKAQEYLAEQEKNFKIINFKESDCDLLQNIKEAYNWPTVPMIFEVGENINFIGGYSNLIEYFTGR